jgi:hypothetical protein
VDIQFTQLELEFLDGLSYRSDLGAIVLGLISKKEPTPHDYHKCQFSSPLGGL